MLEEEITIKKRVMHGLAMVVTSAQKTASTAVLTI